MSFPRVARKAQLGEDDISSHLRFAEARYRLDFLIKPVDSFRPVADVNPLAGKLAPVGGAGFKDAMLQALQATSDLQKESGRLSKEFTLDNSTVSLEETMLAGVKASVAFQATLQVRNRVAQAYTEVMNMQI